MSHSRRKAISWRCSLVAASLTGLVLGLYYWQTGQIPVIRAIPLGVETDTITISVLPYSRLWDILVVVPWTLSLVWFFTRRHPIHGSSDWRVDYLLSNATGLGVTAGLVVGLFSYFGYIPGGANYLLAHIFLSLLAGGISLLYTLWVTELLPYRVGLQFSLSTGLVAGSASVAALGLYSYPIGLGVVLTLLVCYSLGWLLHLVLRSPDRAILGSVARAIQWPFAFGVNGNSKA